MAKDIHVKITTDVEDGEVKGLEDRIENIKNPKIEVDVDSAAVQQAFSNIETGINDLKQGASELVGAFNEVQHAGMQSEQNKAFLTMNLGAEKAKQTYQDISDIVARMPGDDNTMRSVLSTAQALGNNLNKDEMTATTKTMADYMSASATMGKQAIESQQDIMKYLLDGNTAELERGSIVSSRVDKLKEASTFTERQVAMQEVLNELGYGGISTQDTMLNKQAEWEGMLYNSQDMLSSMWLGAEKGAMDFILKLNDATDGIAGLGIAILTQFGPGIASIGQGLMTLTPAMLELISTYGSLGAAASAGFAPIMAFITGPVGIAIAAIIALAIAIYEVGKAFGWWNDLGSMLDSIRAGVMSLWDAFMSNEYVIQIIDLLKQAFTDVWNVVNEVGSAIMSALFGTSGEFDILGMAIQGLQAILSVVGPVIVVVLQGVIFVFQNLYNTAKAVFPYIQQAIITAFSIIIAPIQVGISVFNALQGVWNSAKSTVQNLSNTISSALSTANNAWNSFKSTVMSVIQPIMDKINELKDVAAGVAGFFGMGGVEDNLVTGFNTGGYSKGVGGTVFNITINGNIDSDARINQLKEDFTAIVNDEITENETVIG